ncbi:MAG: 50S ribosomal protein L17 [Candidatus Omnitrophica bacterium]|nr:50S ribosomal protein L17 [Candidatus Omnitrophota bacterium]MBU1933499.1 50S ribosomal protein L17 [Candidatus Omnitrophota bacterium]
MRHRKHTVRFGRQKSHYKATMRHLVSGLIISKSITTTKVKAKEASRLAEKLVTMAKEKSVASRRRAFDVLRSRDLVSTLFNEIAPLFKERNGGYTRVMLTGKRRGDNAQMAILEFVEKPKTEIPEKKEKKKAAAKQPEPKTEAAPTKKPVEKKEEQKRPEKPIKTQPEKPKKPQSRPKPGFFRKIFGQKKGM